MASDLEAAFLTRWRQCGYADDWECEYRFAPPRRFRFDFAHVKSRVAVELDGGTWVRGRHTRGAGYERDCEKQNLAVAGGWRVWHLTADMLNDNPAFWMAAIAEMIGGNHDATTGDPGSGNPGLQP